MYDNNVFHNDDDNADANAMSNEVMSDKEQLLQLYIIRDNVWKHLKTSIKTYYNMYNEDRYIWKTRRRRRRILSYDAKDIKC